MRNILTIMGEISTAARGTNLPERNAMPQTSSTIITVGMRYLETSRPVINIFKAPVGSGGVMSLKRTVIDANTNKRPIKLRTIITAVFIMAPPLV
jgi:hypothetical protein